MKKHDEGYVLAYVMVVVAVMAAISASVSAIAVRNIQTQQNAVQRMQDKYEAEGEIEKIVAELNSVSISETDNKTSVNDAKTAFDEKLTEVCNRYNSETAKLPQSVVTSLNGSKLTCTFNVESVNDSITVKTEITLESEIKQEKDVYVVEKPALTYLSYEADATETTEPTTEPSAGGGTE